MTRSRDSLRESPDNFPSLAQSVRTYLSCYPPIINPYPYSSFLHANPSRPMSELAAAGPQLPAV